jgi:hypothetical protein
MNLNSGGPGARDHAMAHLIVGSMRAAVQISMATGIVSHETPRQPGGTYVPVISQVIDVTEGRFSASSYFTS